MLITKLALQELVSKKCIENRNRCVVVDTASVGLHLDNMFTVYEPYNGEPFTPPRSMPATMKEIAQDDFFILAPGGTVLACTEEEVSIPFNRFGLVQTKGSIARGFISVHMNDGQIDPGYRGKITLEILNASSFYYKLSPGMAIASLYIFSTDTNAEEYNGRYQGSGNPTTMKPQSK